MPVLHEYRDKVGYYVLTSIQGNIITFQLTSEGVKKLFAAGIKAGDRFRRYLLYELCLTGDAFTQRTGPGQIESGGKSQEELDFAKDPEPETLFPRCSICRSLEDLHLVEIGEGDKRSGSLYCALCRKKNAMAIDTSIPLQFVTKGVFERLLELKNLTGIDEAASNFKKLLDKAFQEKWSDLLEKKILGKSTEQKDLFAKEEGQKKLV